jgi:Flp pilus assembly protein TadG
MISRHAYIQQDEHGTAAIEAAIALPVLIMMIYGIFTLGQLFESNAGIQHALGEGARYGTLCLAISSSGSCTLPTGTQIKAKVNSKLFGTTNGTFDAPVLNTSTASTGYATLTVTYHQMMHFAFFNGPTIDVTRSKRVYLPDSPPSQSACTAAAAAHAADPATPDAPPSCSIYS